MAKRSGKRPAGRISRVPIPMPIAPRHAVIPAKAKPKHRPSVAPQAAPTRDLARNEHKARAKSRSHVPAVSPALIRNSGEMVASLRSARERLGLSQAVLDDRAGWADGYTGKLEAPLQHWGKSAMMPSFDEWLQALNVGILLVKLPPRDAAGGGEIKSGQVLECAGRLPDGALARIMVAVTEAEIAP